MSALPTDGLRREQLPNGVTLLVQRRRAAPATALVTYLRAGFLDEPDALAGASHVLEHMIFKGTPTVGPGELARQTKALGGALNAYTAYDHTVYYATVPAANTRAAVTLQADAVRNATIDPEELRRELGVIIQEARRKFDTPSAVAGETLHQLLFEDHRIRRWRIGTEEALEGFTHADIAGYHASRYVPARTIAVLVGDVEPDAGLDILRAAWSDWRRPDEPIDAGPVERSAPVLRTRRLTGDVAQADIILGWRGTGPMHPDTPALDLAASLLSTGRGSRLNQLVREPGFASDVGASHYGADDVGVFVVGAELDASRTTPALAAMAASVRALTERAPDSAEIDRVRTMMQMQFRRHLERYGGRAIALATAEAEGDVTRIDRRERELLDVTPDQVRDAAAQYLHPDHVAAVGYFPASSTARFDDETLREAFRGAARVPPSTVMPEPTKSSHSPAASRSRAQHGVLHVAAGHLDILVARHGDVPQVSLGVWRHRTEFETALDAGLAALAIRSMVRGTTTHDSAQLALTMESLGGSLAARLGADTLGFGATVLPEHVAVAASLLADVLLRPGFDPGAVAVERALLLDDARAVADDAVRFPVQLALGAAFDDTGYGAPVLGTPESIGRIDHADLQAWHSRVLASGRTTVVAVGNGDPERVADLLLAAFGDVAILGTDDATTGLVQPVRAATRVERRDRKQSAFTMLFPGPSRSSVDRFAAETWAAIAGGLGGQLFEALRDRRSLAYTVMASSWQRRHAGGLLTYIATAPDRLEEARAAMLEELATFRAAAPSEADTTRATAMLAGQAQVARQTSGSVAAEIADAWLMGEGLHELDDPGAAYTRLTPDDVHRVAAASLDPASRAEGVLDAMHGGGE
ncbi:MAG: insulinase family protein [Gemmatimonadales bacterium]|nr:insulinase family protein [Gemmatimonadales bacterium]